MMRSLFRIVLLLAFSFSLSSIVQSQAIRTVALSGQHAPGTVGNVRFDGFEVPQLNANGQVLFHASLVGESICCNFFTGGNWNNVGLWTGDSGSLALVARAGDQVPGFPAGVRYSGPFNFTNPSFSSSGQFSFDAGLVGPVTNNSYGYGILSGSLGSINLVLLSGDHAPGTPPDFGFRGFDGPDNFKINSSGQTVFASALTSTTAWDEGNGIWSSRSGTLQLVTREGDHAPGMPADVKFDSLGCPMLNSSGHVVFSAALTGNGIYFGYNRSIWSDRSGSLAAIARTDDPAAGLASGIVFRGLESEPKLDAAGHVAFVGYLAGPGVTEVNDTGIWSDVSGSMSMVVRSGEHAPGTPSGVNFKNLGECALFNSSGKIAFFAGLTGPGVDATNDSGIWSNASGAFSPVMRVGDPAPGVDGKVFGSFGDKFFNDAGQVAFQGYLTNPGTVFNWTPSVIDGLWAQDKAGILRLIVRDGSQIEVAPADTRTVASFEYIDGTIEGINGDGSPYSFNGSGQFAFSAVHRRHSGHLCFGHSDHTGASVECLNASSYSVNVRACVPRQQVTPIIARPR